MKSIFRISAATAVAAVLAAAASCSCGRHTREVRAAAELGQKHASMLCDTTLSDNELHYRLLSIRSREWQMRSNGFDDAADEYISAFEAYIAENNKDLAARIF